MEKQSERLLESSAELHLTTIKRLVALEERVAQLERIVVMQTKIIKTLSK